MKFIVFLYFVFFVNAQKLLNYHNIKRTAVGLKPLQWDNDLAVYAGNYAPYLCSDFKHSSQEQRKLVGRFKRIGENIISTYAERSDEELVDLFYNEIYCYNYGKVGSHCTLKCDSICEKNSPATGCQVNHMTAMMWHDITHLGCSIYKCSEKKITVVCVYGNINGIGGNMLGLTPFNSETAKRLGLNEIPCSDRTEL